MKIYFKVFLFVFFMVVLFNSCRKNDDLEAMHPNLMGHWSTYSSSPFTGSSYTFSSGNNMMFDDKGGNSSNEDDIKVSGKAKYKNGIIKLDGYKFKIVESPVRFDTVIDYGGIWKPTHWKFKIAHSDKPSIFTNMDNVAGTEFYKE